MCVRAGAMRTGRTGSFEQTTTGVILIVVGVALLLGQLDVIDIGPYHRYWPMLLVVIGGVRMIAPRGQRDVPGGAGTVMLGPWLMACLFHWGGLTWVSSWPLIFVSIGVSVILKALFRERTAAATEGEKESGHA